MIGDNDLIRVCKLAKIGIANDEKDKFLEKLNSVFDWIDRLRKIDVSEITTSVDGISGIDVESEVSVDFLERPDEQSMTNTRESLMKNAKFQKFDMFCVPKVVE
ncbi:MAG: aspartyl/glutamyl-tRNA amidotransferase subunit C [Holosporales bacterium]|jgi:aspartyl/glutamyl-tRNA(Asn/Gln) amidotransferase C subunit|nr:aspartyl/glutamyl-tRNA amidotransferase subunit C [Holosporales bacterium]